MNYRSCLLVAIITLSGVARATADDAEDQAEAFIKKRGGKVVRDETKPGKPIVQVDLSFIGSKDDLKQLAQFKKLSILNLGRTHVTGEGFKELANLKELTHLFLNLTRVTDEGLVEI